MVIGLKMFSLNVKNVDVDINRTMRAITNLVIYSIQNGETT